MRNPILSLLKSLARLAGGSGLGRIKPIRTLYDFFFRLFTPRSVMVQGHQMWLDDRDTLELATREVYEPMETKLFLQNLHAGDVVLDIGANIGYYTLIAARLVGPEGRVYAFEPDPVNFQLLKKNVEANGYKNVILVNRAVSNRTQTLRLYLNETNRGDHRVYDSRDGRPSVAIQAVALDDFFKKIDKKVQFIKMDIQGSEAGALEGMKGLIRKNKNLKLVSEFWPQGLKNCGSNPEMVLKSLNKFGFRLSEISEKTASVKPVRPDVLLSRFADGDDYTNLYCVKGLKH